MDGEQDHGVLGYAARVLCYVPMPRKHILHLKKKHYKYAINFNLASFQMR